jgi:hypothetical protein
MGLRRLSIQTAEVSAALHRPDEKSVMDSYRPKTAISEIAV